MRLRTQLGISGSALKGRSEFKQPRQIQGHQEKQRSQRGNEQWLLHLEAPADRLPRAAQRKHQPGQQHERREHADEVRPALLLQEPLFAVGVIYKTHHLDAEHRKHTRHQIEDQPTKKGEQNRRNQTQIRAGVFSHFCLKTPVYA